MKTRDREKDSRDSILLMLLILLFGFICIVLSGGWALRFAPSWKLPADMGSNLNPDSDFLTSMPVGFFEPLDPSILTNPAWLDVFLTPGASFSTRTPIPAVVNTNTPLVTKTNTGIPAVVTVSVTNPPVPTNTLIYFPPPTSTTKPPPATSQPPTVTPTATSAPLLSADLQVTKTDGVTTYMPGSSVTYSIVVTNPTGPSNVTGATVTDSFPPAQITSATWTCVSAGGAACTANGSGNINDSVNIPVGGSVTYTVIANISSSATGNLVNTATVTPPAGYTDSNPGNNSATDTDTPVFTADLGITKTDNATDYEAGGSTTYTIVVSNNGPSGVIGAVVTDSIPAQVATWTWVCTSQNGGATGCDGVASSNTNFTDIVDLPNGASIVYTVTANISASATGTLTNTANINVPVGVTDPNSGNNSATDTPADTLIVAGSFPYFNIGTTPDGSATTVIAPSFVTLQFGTPLVVGGDASYDLVYYPDPNPAPPIQIGAILLWIGDGQNWYPVFYWGDGSPDANTNVSGSLSSPPNSTDCTSEPDNCVMDPPLLYNSAGIAIDVDAVIPSGAYGNFPYIRIISPSAPDVDGGVSVDAIEVLP